MSLFVTRRKRLLRNLKKSGSGSLLVTNFKNVTYLTGFMGDDSYLLLDKQTCVLISDGRYRTQLAEECPDLDVYIRPTGQSMSKAVSRVVTQSRLKELGIESASMSVSLYEELASVLPRVTMVTQSGSVETLRQIKDAHEISIIRRAVKIAEKAFAVFRAGIQPHHTEKQCADFVEYTMRRFGANGSSFPPILAVGERAALPHASPTSQTLGESPILLIDWGADTGLYKSDLTRVLVTGKISTKLRNVYEVVLRAQQEAIRSIRPGVLAKEVDAEARAVIEEAGFGRFFSHSLGHGIGLDIHEAPSLSHTSDTILKPGMVVTVEPGIYLPNWGGVRIEDDVLVTRQGSEVLSRVTKEFDEIIAEF